MSDFDLPDSGPPPSDFDTTPTLAPVSTPTANPITTQLTAAATAPNNDVNQADVPGAAAQLNAGNEQSIRMNLALQRQQQQLQSLVHPAPALQADPEVRKDAVNSGAIYDAVLSRNADDDSHTAIERQAVENIQDNLAAGNTVEAKLTYNQILQGQTSGKVWHDEMLKNLIVAQKLQQFQSEADNESFIGKGVDFLTSLIPLNYLAEHSSLVPGQTTGPLKFFNPGGNNQEASDILWNMSPEQLASSLRDGGTGDQLMRANATTLGKFDPGTAVSVMKTLQYQSQSDKVWANVWGAADVAGVIPWGHLGSIPGLLTRMGSRSLARTAVVDGFEKIMAEGPEAAAKAGGMSASEVASNLETSAMNPNVSNPHNVPLGADVISHMDAVKQVRAELPNLIATSGATNPTEVANAIAYRVKEIENETGRSIKDVSHWYEDVATGESHPYEPGTPLPEQGNIVHYVNVTFGKKSGGGFASAKTAMSEAINRLGITAEPVGEFTTTERSLSNTEMGFTTRAYHGTASEFQDFDHSFAGRTTGAENTAGVTFLTNDPQVAGSYARFASTAKHTDEMAAAKAAMDAEPHVDAHADRYADALDNIMDETGQNIRPVDIDTSNFSEHDMRGRAYNGPETQAIIDHAKAQGKDGVILRNYEDDILNGRPSDIYAVFNTGKLRSSLAGPTITRDVSGQWFAKARFNVPLEGFRTTELATQDVGRLSFLRSDARLVDARAHGKAVAASEAANVQKDAITTMLKNSVKGVSHSDRQVLDEIVKKGNTESKWLTDSQFNQLYERATGKAPNEKLLNAYKTFRVANDFEYTLRNENIYRDLATRGYENVKLNLGETGQIYDDAAKVSIGGGKPMDRVYNSTDNIHYNERNPLTDEDWKRMSGEGYLLVDTRDGIKLPDGTRVKKVLVHRSEIERSALRREQLAYKEGGHRAYTGRNFVKQAVSGVQPDTGKEYLMNPNVFRTSNNPNRLRAWAEIFNQAIDDAKAHITDPQHFDDNVFANTKGLSFPSGADFLKAIDEGAINLDHHVEVVGDRELPSQYRSSGRDDADRFMNEQETSAQGYYRSTGRLYTSSKGEQLLNEMGDLAETVDPWETTNTALENISRLTSFSGYKDNVLERFKNTYADHLKLRDLDSATPYDMIKAQVRDDVPSALARQIKAEQNGVAHILNFETAFEKETKNATRDLANWVLGGSEGKTGSLSDRLKGDASWDPRVMAHDFTYWLQKNNPVNYLRGLAFDATLGLFNVGQFFLQASTMWASAALSPLHGMKGMFGAVPMHAYILSKGSEGVLDALAKNGAWKLANFESEAEFKNYMRFTKQSGFMDVGSSQLSINDFRPNRVFGAASAIQGVREKGRMFFYAAEQYNRAVSTRIAWEELKAAGIQVGSAEFRERFASLADDYSFNMTSTSSAGFQRGIVSIPTQFWAYNVRMIDAMFGNRFTMAQKARLIGSQFMLYGAAGVPAVDAVWNMYKEHQGTPIDKNTIQSFIDRGSLDLGIGALSGADVRVGERLGAGPFLTNLFKDIAGVGEYGEKSTLDTLGGATWSISTNAGKTLTDFIKARYAETGSDDGQPLTRDTVLKMASNVASVSNTLKALMVMNYGAYESRKGMVQVSDLPKQDALWVALGMKPQEIDNAGIMAQFTKNQGDLENEAAKQLLAWRVESQKVPETYDDNVKKANLFVSLLPPSMRADVLRRTNHATPDSFYDHVAQKYTAERQKELFDNE